MNTGARSEQGVSACDKCFAACGQPWRLARSSDPARGSTATLGSLNTDDKKIHNAPEGRVCDARRSSLSLVHARETSVRYQALVSLHPDFVSVWFLPAHKRRLIIISTCRAQIFSTT
ncbi:uncharacterized protein L969DRAFT_87094 [Mixia osmundae IAM 14324]|uniref:uncharacterized protein n=1 Tax=Mixia osmundae (strain CBS 9802 / IAM 14324 / JCM 22182 / KY 12970) TaxID=764103 RepID=UPI0004A554A4|nr:uncharacterized protein L969DRAFT_87094 [Mixia osmundae IAM 14324]KEI40440.1 hypothetical protein L969DRAFT_87094 [Mixia osmundae IAM 14324]